MTGLTAEATAVGIGHQLWLATQLADQLDQWDLADAADELRAWVPGAARRVHEHAELWHVQLPESVLLEPDTRVVPADGHGELVAALARADAHADRSRALRQVLDGARDQLADLVAGAGAVSDGPLLRAGRVVAADLAALLDDLPVG